MFQKPKSETVEWEQASLFSDDERPSDRRKDTASTFVANLRLPIHKWFRYSAGFSALWVRELIEREKKNGRTHILDPFVGSGTVLLEAELGHVYALGIEAHPFVERIARAKLCWGEDPNSFADYAFSILNAAEADQHLEKEYPVLVRKCFPAEALAKLDSLRRAWQAADDSSPLSSLAWLALTSILRKCSPVGTAQWQYVLPRKTKAKFVDPFVAYRSKVREMCRDMIWVQRRTSGPKAALRWDDARRCNGVADGWADLIITSPPYANNYDYADATRLEMTFFGEVAGWGCLQRTVRKHLIRSCTQHVARITDKTREILDHPPLGPIREELAAVCSKLRIERESHGGKKPYHTMVAAYFQDMADAWSALRRVACNGALACFVIGDSAPYGIHVPVERWLGELAIASGFRSYRFEKTRDRNVKWKNRKHRVPLQEGRLWVWG